MRSLSDDYSNFIFTDLLGWKLNYHVSNTGSSVITSGSTSYIMPYNGTMEFGNLPNFESREIIENGKASQNNITQSTLPNNDVLEYVKKYHPFQYEGSSNPYEGTSVSLLKKDGTWDMVNYIDVGYSGITHRMSDWTLHFSNESYARTVDGYLRARITIKNTDEFNRVVYQSVFFVVDYLPQKITLNSPNQLIPTLSIVPIDYSIEGNEYIRLFFSDIEGVERIVVERQRPGSRLPLKAEITDFKKGYYEAAINNSTTFTVVSYNKNGYTRSNPITVIPTQNSRYESPARVRVEQNRIEIFADEGISYDYEIVPLGISQYSTVYRGSKEKSIDITDLPEGLYVLKLTNTNTGVIESLKFKK